MRLVSLSQLRRSNEKGGDQTISGKSLGILPVFLLVAVMTCPVCKGTGKNDREKPDEWHGDWYCDVCRGAKELTRTCPRCSGSGKFQNPLSDIPQFIVCGICKGHGMI